MALRLNDIEAAFRLKADQGLKALDGIVEKSKAADRGLKNLTDTTNKVGLALGAIGAATTAAFGLAIRGAAQERESLAQLEGTVNSTGASFAKQRGRIESFIQGLTRATKFSDDELRPALNRAIVATNDVDKGMRAAELGAKIAAAGFGNLEQNAVVVARLFEGQVQAIGRLIPEFRDLEERLEAGATESDLAAEALARLNTIAANAPSPQPYTQLNKAIGELADTVGTTALDTITPFVNSLTRGVEAVASFAGTTGGRVVTNVTAVAGLLAVVTGAVLLFTAQLLTSSTVVRAWALEVGLAGRAAQFFGAVLSPAGAVIAGLVVLAAVTAKAAIELNNLSRANDEARDKAFQAPRVAQFTAELNNLRGVLAQVDEGTLSIIEAQKEFNRFGLQNIEQAQQRVAALEGIIGRLNEEAAAQKRAADQDAARLAAESEPKRIAAVLKALEEEKKKRIELDVLKDKFEAKELERGAKLAAQVTETPLPFPAAPQAEIETAGLKELTAPGPVVPRGTIEDLTTTENLFRTNAEAVGILAHADAELTARIEEVTAANEAAALQAAAFTENLINLTAGALDGLAELGANLTVDLASGFKNAGATARKFFSDLVQQITRAIAKALILQAIIGAVGGGSRVGRILGGLSQDPIADQLARFEGKRFVDLFFQGVSRELGNARDRMDATLTENRQLVGNRDKDVSVIVNEATPETVVEFTDRKVEPRVRTRARQRTGKITDVVGNPV